MAWDPRGYFYLSRRDGGRVRRHYCGRGPLAAAVAQDLARRRAAAADRRARRAAAAALDDDLATAHRLLDLAGRAALRAAGCHQHQRGEWTRRRRAREDQPPGPG